MGVKHVIVFFKKFTYYEQNMVESTNLFYYYNNVYQGWHEKWYSMMVVKRGNCEWFKKIITIDEGKEIKRFHNKYGWNFVETLPENV